MSEDEDLERRRAAMQRMVNALAAERPVLEEAFGPEDVWDTQELQEDFDVLGFMAPFVVVRRKSDGKKGSLMFQHEPRFYYGWEEVPEDDQ